MEPTHFRALSISQIDTQWQAVFSDYWASYQTWYRQKKAGQINQQARRQAQQQLTEVMPEMLPLYEKFREASRDCPVAAQFLTGYQPPAYLVSCSQAVLLKDEPVLIRNYDLSPDISENLLSHSDWLGQAVIGTNECLWGLDDGMNQAGLAASLTFGGSQQVGAGFGIPFIMRYLLQTCETVSQAIKVLQRVPSHMAYNVTLLDRHGDYATVMLTPGQAAIVTREKCITNHQAQVTWPQQAAFSKTVERKQFLDTLLQSKGLNEQRLCSAFLKAPLRSTNFQQHFGTVYTAVYKPLSETMAYHWPVGEVWQHSLSDFRPSEKIVDLAGEVPKAATDRSSGETVLPVSAVTARNYPSADVRQQLLQGLVYLPDSAVCQPKALKKLRDKLRAEDPLCWKAFAEQLSGVWSYPAPSAR